MKKVLIFLLVLGVLIIGTVAAVEELAEDSFQEHSDFSNFSKGNTPNGFGDITPDGGHGDGDGGIPG